MKAAGAMAVFGLVAAAASIHWVLGAVALAGFTVWVVWGKN